MSGVSDGPPEPVDPPRVRRGAKGANRAKSGVRADAQRNRAAIVRATLDALRRDPDASVADIAAAAGVGRMTLYGHFGTRAELVDAALTDVVERGDQTLAALDLDGDPREVLARLIDSSWMLVDQSRALLAAAQKELPPKRIRERHEKVEARVRALLERGQREGSFRSDLSVSWLLTTTHLVMHGAAEEVDAGRLAHDEAARYIRATLLAAFAPQPAGSGD